MRIRGGVRRVHVVSYKTPEGILGEVFTNEGTGTLVVPDVNALTPAEITASACEALHELPVEQGNAALDERVLRYTAGEDYALDARLVRYDVAASIAHAEMLIEAQLLDGCRSAAPCERPARARRMSMRAGNGTSSWPMRTDRRRSRSA